MPELPEVETIVCGLRNRLIGLEFSKVEVGLEKSVQGSKKSFSASLRGKKILRAERQGKNIILHLSDVVALRVHLRMTGRLRFVPSQAPREKHTHVISFTKAATGTNSPGICSKKRGSVCAKSSRKRLNSYSPKNYLQGSSHPS